MTPNASHSRYAGAAKSARDLFAPAARSSLRRPRVAQPVVNTRPRGGRARLYEARAHDSKAPSTVAASLASSRRGGARVPDAREAPLVNGDDSPGDCAREERR